MFSLKTNIRVEYEIAASGSWIWGVSTWDGGDVWGDTTPSIGWTDLLCESFEIIIKRGCNVDAGILVEPSQNQTTIRMQTADFDPFSKSVIHAGTPVRISVEADPVGDPGTWTVIYEGEVASFATTYDAEGLNIITISAQDSMTKWLNTRLATYSIAAGTSTATVIDDLVVGYWPGNWNLDTTYLATCAATTYTDTTIGQVIRDILNTELGYLYVSQDGAINFISHDHFDQIVAAGADYSFDSTHSTDPAHICMSDLVMDADSRNLPNQILATYASGSATATNQDAVELYGAVAYTVPTIAEDATQLQLILDAITLNTRLRRVQSLTFQAIDRIGDFRQWHVTDRLFSCQNVTYTKGGLNIDENYVVTGQTDKITPTSWDVTLELWKGI